VTIADAVTLHCSSLVINASLTCRWKSNSQPAQSTVDGPCKRGVFMPIPATQADLLQLSQLVRFWLCRGRWIRHSILRLFLHTWASRRRKSSCLPPFSARPFTIASPRAAADYCPGIDRNGSRKQVCQSSNRLADRDRSMVLWHVT
jgi:hypothetical protein